MAKTKTVVRKTVTKRKSRRASSSTVGGGSSINFGNKNRNLDYKYRMVDVDETYSDAVL